MANRKIRDYVPGKNDYLQFAEIMNKNAQIDFQSNNGEGGGQPTVQNPIVTNTNINAGVSTPNTQPLPIGAQAYSQIRGGFKGVLDDSIKGVDSKYTSVYGRALGNSFSPSLYDGGASGGKTESVETGNATGGVGNSAGSGSGAGAVTAPTASGKLSYDNWMKDYGYDPETDYNQAKNDLEYQYMTYLNNYGARAEELYQMGLAGSGISDIYGVNAYSAYLAASNDLALARIEQENEYRRMYKDYSDKFDAAEQLKTETEKSEVGTIAANLVSQLKYSPDKAQSFRDYYKNVEGKSDEWIDSVIESADALYNLNQSTIDVGNIKSQVDAIFKEDGVAYDGSDSAKNSIRKFLAQNNLSQYYDELISTYDAELEESKNAAIEDEINQEIADLNAAVDVVPESIVLSNLAQNVTAHELQLQRGDITQEQYDRYAQNYSDAAVKAYDWATKSTDNMANAYQMFGFDEAEWSKMGDGEREAAIMDAMAEYRRDGLVSESSYNSLVRNWVAGELTFYKEKGRKNLAATVLQDTGGIVYNILSWPISKTESDAIINDIIDSIGLTIEGDKLYWEKGEKGAEATIDRKGGGFLVPEDKYQMLNNLWEQQGKVIITNMWDISVQDYHLVAYNGELYTMDAHNDHEMWYTMKPEKLRITGDGVSNSDAQSKGIYTMIVKLLERKSRDTRR